ncbi:helix-turn-helix transcriptional regulator [Tenggerimyces flavus]|uniref:Helix-turn-helix transcriptional regulator n=1 Tax=Tenggerimyces flavus TaxID=1708749 RepID=A0ABV7Y247_9ACTN|nr:WYL domain-containing protein [Tenggerimyces flavus]MBM7790900.1 putative DNA-binding transcriptional regulator YafY [Tenggerimyces flavus]
MDTASRLLRLLTLLQSRPQWDGEELAHRLEVTTRTVRRDVTRLRSLGYPVSAEAGLGGGYRLGPGGRLPPLLLDDDEAVAIAVGLRVATTTTVSGVEDGAIAALAKLHQVLPARLRERVTAIGASMVQLPQGDLPQVDADVLVTLAAGCRHTEGLRFRYRRHSGEESERSVEPFQIVHTGRRWYLVARDRSHGEWRTFRIDRISAPQLTGMRYRLEDPPDAVALVAEGTGVTPWEIKATLRVHVPAETARRQIPPGRGVVEPIDESTCLVRMAANELGPLVGAVTMIPWEFEVLSPDVLRDAVLDLGARLTRSAVGGMRAKENPAHEEPGGIREEP